MTEFSVIIPARYASVRFPGKLLAMLGDRPVLQHVWEQARRSGAGKVIIATDDERIESFAHAIGADVCMTSSDHQSGTERLSEVVERYGFDERHIVVNVQGDEPFMPPECIDQVAGLLEQSSDCEMATLCHVISDPADIENPNIVKVVLDSRGRALYFSRSVIPHDRQAGGRPVYYRHLGIYAYRAGFVSRFVQLAAGEQEKTESLEQLRALWHGFPVCVGVTETGTGPGIDTPEDLERASRLIHK